MICGLSERVCCVCSNGSVLGQQDLLREIYRLRSLLVYLQSHDLNTAPMLKRRVSVLHIHLYKAYIL